MSTFYLLPPRPILGESFARYLQSLLPGLSWTAAEWFELAELVGAAVARHSDVYIIYGDDLPCGEDPADALAHGFGAEPGDTVIEVEAGSHAGRIGTRSWQIGPEQVR